MTRTYSHTLFLHGFTGGAASWRRVIAAAPLSASISCVDLPGHHRGPEVTSGFEGNVRQLAHRLDPRAAYRVCGYSLGARVALGLLACAPAQVAELVLVGVHPGLTDGAAREARARDDAALARMLRTQGIDSFVDHWSALPLFATQKGIAPEHAREQDAIRRGHDAEGLARCLEELGLGQMPDYRRLLGETAVPVTLVAGEHDGKFRALAGELGRPVHAVPGAGHNVVLERPEAVAELLFSGG